MPRFYYEDTFDVSRDDSEHGVDEGEIVLLNLPYYKVNDERLCRSTQWVVSLNTALSPSSCVVIQDEEYNHTLGSLNPLSLLTHPLRCPDVAIVRTSGRFVAWLLSERTAYPRPAYAPRTHHLGPLR